MAKASDNPFPSALFVEGSAPTSPASGDQRIFLDSADHKLKRVNSSGAVTTIEGGGSGSGVTIQLDYTFASNQTITASAATWYDIIANQNFTASSGSSKVEFSIAASLFTAPTTITADAGFGLTARVVIDSAGTPVTKPVGSSLAPINNAQYIPLCLGRTIFLTGLAAGTHTVKLQANADLAGTIYCRPVANPSAEYAAIQVLEHL